MASIANTALEKTLDWAGLAIQATSWAQACGVNLRSVIVLVPFAQHLPPARRAFAQLGGWQPRVETTRTLVASLGPAPRPDDGQLTLDVSTDRLHAARLLRSQSWVNRDPRAFDESVAAVVTTAHALVRASAAIEPAARAEHWQRGRDTLALSGGPGGSERALARVALEWAALAPARATDLLFSLKPGAWIVVQAGGEDALARRLLDLAANDAPCLTLDTDIAAMSSLSPHLSLCTCDSFEDEAERAAAQVLAYLRQGMAPVALVAQDRALVRRIRALLERRRVSLHDETGWTLSTTRAAAQLMSLLRAAAPTAATDLLLDWLKAGAWPHQANACTQLESICRREAWVRISEIDPARLSPHAATLHAEAIAVIGALVAERRRSLAAWLSALQSALQRSGMWGDLSADEAGQQLLQTLRLIDPAAWVGQAAQTAMNFADFTAWVDSALEAATFMPAAPPEASSVVITPLARVMLRPFAAVVFPGADDRHLGATGAPQPLLSDAQALALGVPTAVSRRETEALAFAHAVSTVPVSLFHRHSDGAEPLSVSPLVERLRMRLQRAGRDIAEWQDPRSIQIVVPAPIGMPAPSASHLLPARLSASACEALRACPYRFHALHLLRLREADELDDEIEKRDYGTWLHAVLLQFHLERGEPASAESELATLMAVAQAQKLAHRLDDADFLPFDAAFAELAPRYITWLHDRDAAGARWWQGEQDRQTKPDAWQGVALHGRIDRMDHVPHGIELIDYKSGSAGTLKDKVKQPLEDTQLAFYAALIQAEIDAPLNASYVVLGRRIEHIKHPEVARSARVLVQGLGDDILRIRSGAGLPALGEGQVCDFCEARGLCRRDHWSTA